MNRRWGLQAAMTATYVAVTAGVVLLTELVIFGVAALSPPTPLTPQRSRDSPRSAAGPRGEDREPTRDLGRRAASPPTWSPPALRRTLVRRDPTATAVW